MGGAGNIWEIQTADIELGAVAMDGVSFHQGGNTILGRTVGLPETTVGNDLGVLGL